MALFIPVAIGLAGTRINVLVNTILVTPLAQGSVSWLNYAFRIMHLPLGLFGIAVGTVALPSLSRLVLENDAAAVRSTLSDSLKMVLFLTVPTSALIAFLAVPVTRVIYERGRFTAADTVATAEALVLYMLGIPFIAGPPERGRGLLRLQGRQDADVRELRLDRPQHRPQRDADAGAGLPGLPAFDDAGRDAQRRPPLRPAAAQDRPLELGPLAAYAGRLAVASAAGGGAAWLGNRLVSARARDLVPRDRGERRRLRASRAGRLLRRARASSASPRRASTSAASSADKKKGPGLRKT